jgi:hypothetical protein
MIGNEGGTDGPLRMKIMHRYQTRVVRYERNVSSIITQTARICMVVCGDSLDVNLLVVRAMSEHKT